MSVEWFQPRLLEDLFGVFRLLEKGASVGLAPASVAQASAGSQSLIEPLPPLPGAWLGVNSSGSTGTPKLVWRAWQGLLSEARKGDQFRGWTWASPFAPHTFAGVQVALQAWVAGGNVLSLPCVWAETWNVLALGHVEALSCTPTFIDLLLQNESPGYADWQPRQITLGGEVFRPMVGQRIGRRFPQTRVTVIYATAEHGVLLKTHRLDGWYETGHFQRRGIEWRIEDGRLDVKRGAEWLATGDQVEVKGDLLRVVGRADAVANVAGTKVSLAEVAESAEQVAGVRRAVATAEPSPVTGQIVCLRYAVEPGFDPRAVLEALETHLRERLRKEAWPRRWELDEVGLGPNAKRRAVGVKP
jgi:acyl-CoA synthetase (AMP-forming)/AMP-acid ligase II